MTSSADSPPARSGRILLRAASTLVILLLLAAAYADRTLKTASHPGFLPENLPVYFCSADMPQFWSRLSRTPVSHALSEEAPYVLHDLELAVRRTTGIRPTPARLGTWLGKHLCGGTDGRDWIVCAHPGLAARAASHLFGPDFFGGAHIFVAWRDGYLICSSSSDLLQKSLSAPPVTFDTGEPAPSSSLQCVFHCPGATVALALNPSVRLPITADISAVRTPQTNEPGQWNQPPLGGSPALSLSVRNGPVLLDLHSLFQAALCNTPVHAEGLLPISWNIPPLATFFTASGPLDGPASLGFYGLSPTSDMPLPRLALGVRTKTALSSLLPVAQAETLLFPYRWNGYAGWMFPLLGDQFSLYSFQRDDTQYVATQETLAAILAFPTTESVQISDDFLFTVRWKPFVESLTATTRWITLHGAFSKTNGKDLDTTFSPLMNALAKCGTCELRGRWHNGILLCTGTLADALPRTEKP